MMENVFSFIFFVHIMFSLRECFFIILWFIYSKNFQHFFRMGGCFIKFLHFLCTNYKLIWKRRNLMKIVCYFPLGILFWSNKNAGPNSSENCFDCLGFFFANISPTNIPWPYNTQIVFAYLSRSLRYARTFFLYQIIPRTTVIF